MEQRTQRKLEYTADQFQWDEVVRTIKLKECYIPIVRNQIDPDFCKLYDTIEAKSDSDDVDKDKDEEDENGSSLRSNELSNAAKVSISQRLKKKQIRRTKEDMKTKLKCPKCEKKFDRNYKLKKHMETHQSPQSRERPFHCTEENCGKSYYIKYHLERHIEDSHITDKGLECEVCHKSFQTMVGLKGHQDTHLEDRERKFRCHLCSKKFFTKSTLRKHSRTHVDADKKRQYECSKCDKTFHDNFGLNRHMKTHQSVSKRKRPYICTEENCGKQFYRMEHLNAHSADYHAEKPPECDVCHKSFESMSRWRKHKRNQHLKNRTRSFICHICSKGFFTRSSLIEHVRRHADQRQYECDLCDKAFNFPYPLKLHKRTVHDRDYPYRCSECGRGFGKRNEWTKHSQSCANKKKKKLMNKSQKKIGAVEKKSDLISMEIEQEVKKEVQNNDDIIINCVYTQNQSEELDHLMIVTDVKMEFPIT